MLCLGAAQDVQRISSGEGPGPKQGSESFFSKILEVVLTFRFIVQNLNQY